ncbi:fatty acid 2-hydroxylase [Odontomachus brunneus]|uniref:fatty acid 2-hydroxylase n=1 Tax=Odontomachus brunneus TaxID=486640 RepID=UPI0013F19462|nr:fatty acid 2-hydroxylase [Odontomachus brunneus]
MDTSRDKNSDNEFNLKCVSASDVEATDFDVACAHKMEACRNSNHVTNIKGATEFLVKYRGRIYDVINFLDYHPGGKNMLVRHKDRILDEALVKHPHSKSAYYLLEEFAVHRQERYNECENLINWDAPILWQVSLMGHRYWEWVNLPVNRPIRFFQSDILEILSITPWYLVPVVWVPLAIYFFYTGCVLNISTNLVVSSQKILLSFTLGILIWTLMEYFVHRKIFHLKPPHNSRLLITLHFLFHGNHHKAPLDGRRLVFPPIFSVAMAGVLWQIYKVVFPLTMVHLIAAGTIIGYLCYDLTHYYLHNGAPKVDSYLYTMKRRHNYHHFVYHNQGFGVTSELWDQLLKTDLTLRKLEKPLEW